MFTHTQQEILDHNERIKQLIPPEQLLIYEVGEGWDRLVEFLGVYVHIEVTCSSLLLSLRLCQSDARGAIPTCK